jgi:hypothetical protein
VKAPADTSIKSGETATIDVVITREKFNDPVELVFIGLPDGVVIMENDLTVSKDVSNAKLTLKVADTAKPVDDHKVTVRASGGAMKPEATFRALFEERASRCRSGPVFVMSSDLAWSRIFPVPKEEAYAALEANSWKYVGRAEIIVDRAQAIVGEHGLPELIKLLTTRKPSGRNNHRQVAWLQRLCLLYEMLINGRRALSKPTVIELIRRVANDHVELHIASKRLCV